MNSNTLKAGILAAAALALTVPAVASAQPVYGSASHGYRQDVRPSDFRGDGFRSGDFRRDDGFRGDFRRIERERKFRRAEQLRRLRWEREHRYGYGYSYYR